MQKTHTVADSGGASLGPWPLSGFSTAGSKFLSIVRRARMVSTGDNGVYTGSGLRGELPYVQCAAAVFLSQVCS
jgi:hypothetical protein